MSGDPRGASNIRFRPHLWYLATTAAGIYLVNTWLGLGPPHWPLMCAIGGPAIMAATMKLELDPSGVRIQSARASWGQFQLIQGTFGYHLKVPASIEPRRRRRINLFLAMWEPNWRNGKIGAHLARYAPGLLAQVD